MPEETASLPPEPLSPASSAEEQQTRRVEARWAAIKAIGITLIGTTAVGLTTAFVNLTIQNSKIALESERTARAQEQEYLTAFAERALSDDLQKKIDFAHYVCSVSLHSELRTRWCAFHKELATELPAKQDALLRFESELAAGPVRNVGEEEEEEEYSETDEERIRELRLAIDALKRQIYGASFYERHDEENFDGQTSSAGAALLATGSGVAELEAFKKRVGFKPDQIDLQRYPKMSFHEHYRAGGNIGPYLDAMDAVAVRRAVFVPTGLAPDNKEYKSNITELLSLQGQYPERLIAFCTIEESAPDAIEQMLKCFRQGGRGLKLLGWHPKFFDWPEGVEIDGPEMRAVFDKVRDVNLPILIHINLLDYPDWKKRFENVLDAYPDITFIAAHYCKYSPAVEKCGALLDKHDNLYTDTSMGGRLRTYLWEVANNREAFRDFLIRHQDKILWGVDFIVDNDVRKDTNWFIQRMKFDIVLLETSAQIPEGQLPERPAFRAMKAEDVQMFGLGLPEEVLRKIYWENAERILRSNAMQDGADVEKR